MDKTKKNKLTVAVGIAAYNAGKNIGRILDNIINQKEENYILKEIIVHSDDSQDDTVMIASGVKDKRIRVVDNKKRRGFAGTVKYLLGSISTDILVILNDDIRIDGVEFIEKLIEPFLVENGVGLTCGLIYPLSPKDNFIEKMAVSSANIYNHMRLDIKNPNNRFTYDGAAMALSRSFIESLEFLSNIADIGNVDGYLYYSCLSNGFKYRNAPEAKFYFRAPSTLADYISRTSRNTAQSEILKKTFGQLITNSYKKPKLLFLRSYLREFVHNPVGCVFLLFIGVSTRLKAKKIAGRPNQKWDSVESTKALD